MNAEEVYNIAIHLPQRELERLYILLEKKVSNKINASAISLAYKSQYAATPSTQLKILFAYLQNDNSTTVVILAI